MPGGGALEPRAKQAEPRADEVTDWPAQRPHAGDDQARRFSLDPVLLSQLHAAAVGVFLGLQLAALAALRITRATAVQQRVAMILLGASLVQGLIGYVQYALDLPVLLVAAHVLGAALLTLATTYLVLMVARLPAPGPTHVARAASLG